MKITPRRAALAFVCAILVFAASYSPTSSASVVGLGRAWGSISSSAGFLPAGHWIDSPIQGLTQVFPQPDSATPAYAREHQAYWDGTNDIPYDLTIGVSFGAYPYVFQLVSGPPGMSIEQTTYSGFQNKAYGRILWHPQGNISAPWNGEVVVKVTDQQRNTLTISYALWTVGQYSTSSFSGTGTVTSGSTTFTVNSGSGVTPGMVMTGTGIPSGDYITTGSGTSWTLAVAATGSASAESVSGSYAGGAVFASATGTGSTCTYSAPCLLSTAFGSTYATTANPGAIVYAFGGTYSGTADLPQYTDSGVSGFTLNASTKPDALIGMPGGTVTLDASADGGSLIQTGGSGGNDFYMENVTANGYDTGSVDRLIYLSSNRLTFDQVCWTNSGYGTGTAGNESMFVSGGSNTPDDYLFITDSCESNRESGTVGNNYGFNDTYSYGYALIQRSTENSPSASLDGVFYYKSDVTHSELRENYADVGSAPHAFSYGQAQDTGIGNDASDYNLAINASLWFDFAGTTAYTWGAMSDYRNTIIAGSGHGLGNYTPNANLGGPYISSVTSAAGGSLTAGDTYYLGMTSTGVSGESQMTSGSYGNSATGFVAGEDNVLSLTIAAGDGSAVVSFRQEPGASANNLYGGLAQAVSSISCSGTTVTVNTTSAHGLATGAVVYQAGFSPGGWNGAESITVTGTSTYTYTVGSCPTTATTIGTFAPMQLIASALSPSAGSYTWTGTATTATYPPLTNTAVSAYRFSFDANAVSSTYTPLPPTGNAMGAPSPVNVIDSSGTGTIICTSVTTGCAAIGDLNTTYSGYSSDIGTVGYQIQ